MKNRCYTAGAKKFENKLTAANITYDGFCDLQKVWKEMTAAEQIEVDNLLKYSNKRHSAIIEKLLEPDVLVILDIDGTMALFEMGECNHIAVSNDKWQEYLRTEKPYEKMKPIPQIKAFVADKGVENIYVCSKAFTKEEREQKTEFVTREYGILKDNVHFVTSNNQKAIRLKNIASNKRCELSKIALVDDTIETLDAVYELTGAITVHISSFFTY